MIQSQDRSGYIGASDTKFVLTKFSNKQFQDWWQVKLGNTENHFNNAAMHLGTIYEHPILEKFALGMGINMEFDKQYIVEDLKLRVNLDGNDEDTIYECKTRKDKNWKLPQSYIDQVRVQMFVTGKKGVIVDYLVTPEDYAAAEQDEVLEIDPSRIGVTRVDQDLSWIREVYLPRLKYLAYCLAEKKIPKDEEFKHFTPSAVKNQVRVIPNEKQFNDLQLVISNLDKQKKSIEEQKAMLEQMVLEYMETNGIKSYENDILKVTYVAPTSKITVDSKKLKELYPDIAEECSKETTTKASLRIKVNE